MSSSGALKTRTWRRGNSVQKGKYNPETVGAVLDKPRKDGRVPVLWLHADAGGDRAWKRWEKPDVLRRATAAQRSLMATWLVLQEAVHAGYLERVPA